MSSEKNKKYYLYELENSKLMFVSLVLFALMMVLLTFLERCNIITYSNNDMIVVCLLYFPYLMLHEILHSISYVIHGAKFKNITYGVHLEKGVLCCLCKENITKKNILWSLMYPFLFIGVITLIIGIVINSYCLVLLSILNIAGCSGDLVMFFDFLTLDSFEYSEYDNPIAFGLYSNKDFGNKKMFCLKYVGEADSLERNSLKKIDCNLLNTILILILIIVAVILIII